MNPNLSNHEVIGQIMMSLLLDGNCYLATLRDNRGQVLEITVLDPTTITPNVEDVNGKNLVTFTSTQAPGVVYDYRDICHLRNLMKPGTIEGISPITAAREMIGLGLGAQAFGAAFGNGGIPGALVEVPGQLSEEGVKQLKSAWNDTHRGASNSHRLAVLTEGAKFSSHRLERGLSVSPYQGRNSRRRRSIIRSAASPTRRRLGIDVLGIRPPRTEHRLLDVFITTLRRQARSRTDKDSPIPGNRCRLRSIRSGIS